MIKAIEQSLELPQKCLFIIDKYLGGKYTKKLTKLLIDKGQALTFWNYPKMLIDKGKVWNFPKKSFVIKSK